ncbi:LacI family DNA-binding transcriptional regulator [Curtobacterium flaccumfaciens]|uniref:LacI family DNA-binding transcriptional regulator n=1 Tax=Curtobacterium flaccumfaciens TaxID=2035 RepID=UPI003F80F6BC
MTTDTDDPDRRPHLAGRLPTMRDVAERVGMSRQLVSLVLRGAPGPSAESRDRILAAAEELGYRPHTSARLLREGRTRLIGAVFSMRNPFQVRFVERLFARAAELGFGVALGPAGAERSTDEVVADLLGERVEALVVFNPDPGATSLEDASRLVPVVLLGEWTNAPYADNVHVDEAGGLRAAVEHLVGLGHRRITYVGGEDGLVGRDRADAYRDAMRSAGLTDEIDVVPSGFSEEGGASAARSLVGRPALPTAVICCGDQCATGLLAVLARHDVQVPERMSVVGFDDSYLASLSYHRLTSVHQDVEETVDAALASVVDRVDANGGVRRRVATATALVVRDSTGPAVTR